MLEPAAAEFQQAALYLAFQLGGAVRLRGQGRQRHRVLPVQLLLDKPLNSAQAGGQSLVKHRG